ncbi:MAG: PadR family transcriptional regulator [Candidatus Limnocylindrales bacterium]
MFQYDHHDPARSMHEREIRRAFRAHRREPRGEFRAEFGRGAGPGAGPGFGGHGAHRGWWRLGFIGGGPRVRRGDVRSAILALLAEEPMHGYQIINELETRSGGRWRPSAGSVYPTLQQLEDEGLVRAEERDGRRVFTLTEAGRKAAEVSTTRGGAAPWGAADDDGASLRNLLVQVAAATVQIGQVGSPELTVEARKILTETRRSLYRLLAEDDGQAGPTSESTAAPEAADSTDKSTDQATGGDSTEPIA